MAVLAPAEPPPTFTRHYGADAGDRITVSHWPQQMDVTPAFLDDADQRWVQNEGDTLRFTLANGNAVYQRVEGQPLDADPIRYVRVDASCARDDLLEALSDAEHASWANWMDYLFSKCDAMPDGSMVIPRWAVERWRRQAATPYAELSEQEKESDRDEVRKILPLIERYRERK